MSRRRGPAPAGLGPGLVLAAASLLTGAGAPTAATTAATAITAPAAAATSAAAAATAAPTPPPADSWAAVDRLIDDQKLEQAAVRIEALRAAAERRHDDAIWARALVRATEVRGALGGFETAVRQLREARWPPSPLARTELELYYAHALRAYAASHSWEIGHRERMVGDDKLDLDHWTREQIAAAADAAFRDAWSRLPTLGARPVAALDDVLLPNSYPAAVRGTVGDAMAYLFVDFLTDTSLWTPDQVNDLYRLDLAHLLVLHRPTEAAPAPTHPHPMVELVAVLADLESWHAAAGRRAAALEAHLERLRRLDTAFTQPADRRRIRAALAARLEQDRGIPWWAEGQAVLADLLRRGDQPQALVEARAAALAGERAYPGSPGAKDCRQIVAAIEQPGFTIQAMTSDGPDRRSLAIDHQNLPRLYLRAYAVDVARRLDRGVNEPFVDAGKEQALLASGIPAARWTVELPATPDFRQHRTYDVPPLTAPGAYVVLASARPTFSRDHNQVLTVSMVIGDLVLLEDRQAGRPTRLRALSGTAGEPLPGVEIQIYRRNWQTGASRVETLTTGAGGEALFSVPRADATASYGYLALARHGADLALLDVAQPAALPAGPPAALYFTDRSIYRPGQTVRWKVLAYERGHAAGRPVLSPHATLTVTLADPNGQAVAATTAVTNDFGTAAGEFVVPAGRPLGTWELRSSLAGQAAIQVEEYKRPTFEVSLPPPAAAPRLNRPAAFRGEARYYFGLPVTRGTVRWRVTRATISPSWWWWVEGPARGLWSGPERGEQQIAAGSAQLGAGGTFTAEFTPAGDERLGKDWTFSYRLHAEVTDDGGETRTAERSFRLGLVAVEAEIASEQEFLDRDTAAAMTVLRRDLDGTPRPGAGAWRLLRLIQPQQPALPADEPATLPEPADPALPGGPAAFHTRGDALAPRWQRGRPPAAMLHGLADGALVARGELAHDAGGSATVALPPLAPGAYRLRYETRDDDGGIATAQRDFLVAGDAPLAAASWLEVQRRVVHVGEAAVILVHSGFPGQPLELEIRRGTEVERRALIARAAPQRIELPVGEAERGGIALRLTAVRDHQLLEQEAGVAVPWDDRQLRIEVQSFRDLLRPGARETWRVKVTARGAGGAEPAAAELLAYMYDRSLDAYAPHQPPRPIDLFPSTAPPGWLGASLGAGYGRLCLGEHFGDLPDDAGLAADRPRTIDAWGIGGPGARRYLPTGGLHGVIFGGVEGGVAGGVPGGVVPPPMAPKPSMMALGDERAITFRGGAPRAEPESTSMAPRPRTDFSETAFWQPHLLTAADGTAAIEFTVPDSVTAWSFWVHALTKDLRSGSDHREARSVKDLMVRPYLPRFLREGDRAELRVEIDDAAERPLDGEVTLEILDPERPEQPEQPDQHGQPGPSAPGPAAGADGAPARGASLLADFGVATGAARRRFHVEAGRSAAVSYELAVPKHLGPVAFKVVATAGDTSDGELRPLPVLPSRLHLAQSRFVALHGSERRTMTFEDLRDHDDPTRIDEQLVVTLDAQLFDSVLAAVPYLVEYPYECTEQTLNRFLSTAILTSLFDRYPAIARRAQELARRDTELAPFGGPDANRGMELEETPWLVESRGEAPGAAHPLLKVLDPRIAAAQRESALAKLAHDQLPSGAFPWWSGGPPSDSMTLYLLSGLARAGEFGVAVPRDLVVRGWRYLGEKYQREIRQKLDNPDCDCAWEFLTLLNYVASASPDPSVLGDALPVAERRRILDACFRHWREDSPYLKGLLALTLQRMGRPADARLVFDSVMDSAQTTPDEGTFWRPEAHAWLWYNDTIESHAFALRALMELRPEDPRLPGLVQWLFLNKKLNHWKSTRATAEVIYSLARYLDSHHELAVREVARVEAAGETSELIFDPDHPTGEPVQIVVPGGKLGREGATVVVGKETPGLLFASATWHFSTEELPKEARGDLFAVERQYFRRVQRGKEMVLEPFGAGTAVAPGDEIEVHLVLRSRAPAEYVHLRDPRPAGFEPGVAVSGWRWDLGFPRYEEVRDSGTNFFFENLPAGEVSLQYRVRAAMAGTFRAGPATVQSMYAPEFAAYSAGAEVRVAPAGEP